MTEWTDDKIVERMLHYHKERGFSLFKAARYVEHESKGLVLAGKANTTYLLRMVNERNRENDRYTTILEQANANTEDFST